MSLLELIPGEGAPEKHAPTPTQEKGKAKPKKEPAEKGKAHEESGPPKKAAARAAAPKARVKQDSAARAAKPSGATVRRAPRGKRGGGE
jgi:hypothetical protein